MRREADFPGEPNTIGELMTTPTRDEAVLRIMDDLRPYARKTLGSIRIDVVEVCKIVEWYDSLASAPAPASGGVVAVAVVGWTFEFLGYDGEWGRAFAFLDQGEPTNGTGAIVRNVVPVRRAA
ncbi:hypothetical protein [Bosea sp. (in: a-proteobacteria)]|uniref:hypothetical protein n=1 Tax=Bosea sp. (in: a-proteobacteria) TaxID=1871050 RepID=UPI00261943A9|nr:hypothetical protein [Bosea sp. (in: a-proteobacteria)]MCO5092092.1 hypothetical protein [Bosea sp. (in: a-proteobacteria)]